MTLVFVLIGLGILFAVAAVVAGRSRLMSAPTPDETDTRLPPGEEPMAPEDVDGIRFQMAFRGYRMDQVDGALDRLRDELRGRDARIASLQGGRSSGPITITSAPPSAPAPPPASGPPPPTWTPPVASPLPADDAARDMAFASEADVEPEQDEPEQEVEFGRESVAASPPASPPPGSPPPGSSDALSRLRRASAPVESDEE